MIARTLAWIGLVASLAVLSGQHDARPRPVRGIADRPAPSWGVTDWHNLPRGRTTLDVADYRGKVVYLSCFQSWCPGCHRSGFPTLRAMIDKYADAVDVAFVAVQTVFEGYGTNTPAAARRTARRYDLEIPVGHDGSEGRRSVLMGRYRTGGTPWTVIIDKAGVVRFNDFHTSVAAASALVDRLRAESAPPRETVPTLPARRGGQDVVGTKLPALIFDDWIAAAPKQRKPRRGEVTLYRWWTDTCPHCEKSLPALEKLRAKYADRGLNVVGVYHPKPPRDVERDAVRDAASKLGFRGVLAVDRDWSELKRFYLRPGTRRPATSMSVLVDRQGVIRFVHPGPVLFPSDDQRHERENADYALLEQAVRAVLAER
jgi:thiol-disulfide isomerase/thioredoxin